ncbi:MAG TPA: serine hydrolase domain-containing protein [Tepidisphaeraceae bacterium]|jgi:CubicO group peptidase (beta-lactamase class C family)|nr:serine hydrolase domain-containing protein [Tepidisphaeraceae bacterium]HEV8604559.1 serine hydrolase domain-containing protein [Tepidisphaeraceae bacterium]
MRRFFGLSFILFAASLAAAAPPKDLSPLLDPIVSKHDVPGMVAVMIEGDAIISSGASGVRRRGDAQKVTLNDRFHIGSCTKAMTATLCAVLVEEGKLSWDRTLAQAFPELKTKMHEQYRAVTLEQLLTNRAGVPGDITKDEVWAKLWAYRGPPMGSRKLLLENLVINAPQAPPGDQFIYSNAGFSIAGHMAERAMNKSWEQLLQEKLFKPLNMKSAGFGPPGAKNSLTEPRGHEADGKPVEPGSAADNPAGIGPGGIVHCSIGDWARFVSLHLKGERGQSTLLKPETFKKLHTPNGDYAMGWIITTRRWAKGPVLTHSGTNTMWYAVVWASPEDNFAVLVMCNQGGDSAAKSCDAAASAIIASRK